MPFRVTNLVMVSIFAPILLVAAQQSGPPPEQNFFYSASLGLENNVVSMGGQRIINPGNARNMRMPMPKDAPPYRWKWANGSAKITVEPVSGQGTAPKVSGLEQEFENPPAHLGGATGSSEGYYISGKVDWKGCKPGFYRLLASVKVEAENGDWTMSQNHHLFYWRPMPDKPNVKRVGQKFLMLNSSPKMRVDLASKEMTELVGTTLTMEKFTDTQIHRADATLKSDKTGKTVSTQLSFDSPSSEVAAVYKDKDAKALSKKYVGKTVYLMGRYLSLVLDHQTNHLKHIPEGSEVVIKDIWRSAKPQNLSSVSPYICGGRQDFLSGWYPLYVVLEAKRDVFPSDKQINVNLPIVTLVADPWAFERVFSQTTKEQDFKDWKPNPGGGDKPTFIEVGLTPKQLAWMHGWPSLVAPIKQTLSASHWVYDPADHPQQTYVFNKGKLQPGPGVLKR